jgi:dynein heavy chain, axonemal
LDRKKLQQDLSPQLDRLMYLLENEMDIVKKLFDEQKHLNEIKKEIKVQRNMPRVAGAIKWCQEVKDRATKPFESFTKLYYLHSSENVIHIEKIERIKKKHKELLELIDDFSANVYKEWCANVDKLSENNLDKELIKRDSNTKTISTNFDPQLIAVLREVKYLKLLNIENIPEKATEIDNQHDVYRKFITCLDYTVDSYNKILMNASEEEKPLIKEELNRIDIELEKGIKTLKWKSPGIDTYITETQNKVCTLETELQQSKFNCEKISILMATWKTTPIFKRFEAKSTLLQLDDKQIRLDNRYKEIREAGNKIHDLVNVNMKYL